ncbi:hypothetical protein OMK64_20320, partial [Cellulomonas fimi]|nr:hypothetical protein [Cellulomonas fimi]
SEIVQVRKEMRRELVQRMILRLQLLTPVQLEALQQQADNKAKADADALKAAKEYEDNTPKQSPVEVPVE